MKVSYVDKFGKWHLENLTIVSVEIEKQDFPLLIEEKENLLIISEDKDECEACKISYDD